jgi:hypothetical protein
MIASSLAIWFSAMFLAVGGLYAAWICTRRAGLDQGYPDLGMPTAVYLFKRDKLVDACPSARQRLGELPPDGIGGACADRGVRIVSEFRRVTSIRTFCNAGREFEVDAPAGALRGRVTSATGGGWNSSTPRAPQRPVLPNRRRFRSGAQPIDGGQVAWGNAAWRALARNLPASVTRRSCPQVNQSGEPRARSRCRAAWTRDPICGWR